MRLVWRYCLAVIAVAAALMLTRSLQHYTDITPLFYAAIIVWQQPQTHRRNPHLNRKTLYRMAARFEIEFAH